MSTRVKVTMKPVSAIVTRLGLGKDGDVQRFHTNNVNDRIGKYMPYRSSALSTKLKIIKSSTEIEVQGPYARYMYYGEIMVDPVTGAAGFRDKDGQWKSRKNVPKVRSGRPIDYSQSKNHNPLAGPLWDRHLSASEGNAMAADIQRHVDRKAGKR